LSLSSRYINYSIVFILVLSSASFNDIILWRQPFSDSLPSPDTINRIHFHSQNHIQITSSSGLEITNVVNTMSFDQLSSMESQPTNMRRNQDPEYADDPEFQKLSQSLMDKLFTLTGNISRLSSQIALLGTKRETERVRERVQDLLEETKETFKDVGEGVKQLQSWEDVSVWLEVLLLATSIKLTFTSHLKNTRSKRYLVNSKLL